MESVGVASMSRVGTMGQVQKSNHGKRGSTIQVVGEREEMKTKIIRLCDDDDHGNKLRELTLRGISAIDISTNGIRLSKSNGDGTLEKDEDQGGSRKSSDDEDLDFSARETLKQKAKELGVAMESLQFARSLDAEDSLAHMRQEFCIPKIQTLGKADTSQPDVDPEADCVYFCGNSLGLPPRAAAAKVAKEMARWAEKGVGGHFTGDVPWAKCDEVARAKMAAIVGAKESEVAIMNGLTINLHLALVAFYRPTTTRFKILYEDQAFPSDHYAFLSQVKLKGFNPDDALLAMKPREGEETLRKEDILKVISEEGPTIALICFPGVQYYTGQLFDMATITRAGHDAGCIVGWDLAHAVGNVELRLHEWVVDFAVWCSYKYLNSGAGALAGFFVHDSIETQNLDKLLGWWSHKLDTRFEMNNVLHESPGADAFRISNPSVFAVCPVIASMEVFSKTSIRALRRKSLLLTAYLELLLDEHLSSECWIITPRDPRQRGAQLSVQFRRPIKRVHERITAMGVVCDFREPAVIRLAPVPLYNSFVDVARFVEILRRSLDDLKEADINEAKSGNR